MFSQIVKFGSIGVLNTILDFTLFNLLVWFFHAADPVMIFIINAVSVSIAILNSYLCNRTWTFQWHDDKTTLQINRFIFVSAGGLIINSLAVYWMAGLYAGRVNPYIWLNTAKIMAALLSSSWNFILYRNWVFKPFKPPHPPAKQPKVEKNLLSIIIPAFNESKRLPNRLQILAETLPHYFSAEILVVDDGSQDATPDLVDQIALQFPCVRLIRYTPNQGKGKAVQTGMLSARGEYLLFCDADDTFSPQHIIQIGDELLKGKDVVIACRPVSGSQRLSNESKWRCFQGRLFNQLVQALLLPGLKDTQCGLKGFSRKAADALFPLQRTCGFAFDVEILCLARHMNFEISELEVEAFDCDGSQVRKILSPAQMGLDIIKLKLAFLTHRYPLPQLSEPRSFKSK